MTHLYKYKPSNVAKIKGIYPIKQIRYETRVVPCLQAQIQEIAHNVVAIFDNSVICLRIDSNTYPQHQHHDP